jgi:hypothetical protein
MSGPSFFSHPGPISVPHALSMSFTSPGYTETRPSHGDGTMIEALAPEAGVVGSMTHCEGYRAAAVARPLADALRDREVARR